MIILVSASAAPAASESAVVSAVERGHIGHSEAVVSSA